MDSALSLVDFIEIYDGPKLYTGAANLSHLVDRQQHQPIHYQQEVAPRQVGVGEKIQPFTYRRRG